jgi:gluconate 5-dehydrogenase
LQLFDLKGKLAVVTGSSRGIGFALAKALASAGARVILNGRDRDSLSSAAQRLAAQGCDVMAKSFDVTDQAVVVAAIDHIELDVGPIDILVNNAGYQYRAPLEEFPPDQWRLLVQLNLHAAFYVGQAVARHMIKRRRGKIINICSVQSELARPSIAPYAATKGALKMLTKGMCADWAQYGMQINALAPGYLVTELTRPLVENADFSAWLTKRTPTGRWGLPEDLAGPCVFLASAAADFVNGQILFVDGGLTSVV